MAVDKYTLRKYGYYTQHELKNNLNIKIYVLLMKLNIINHGYRIRKYKYRISISKTHIAIRKKNQVSAVKTKSPIVCLAFSQVLPTCDNIHGL